MSNTTRHRGRRAALFGLLATMLVMVGGVIPATAFAAPPYPDLVVTLDCPTAGNKTLTVTGGAGGANLNIEYAPVETFASGVVAAALDPVTFVYTADLAVAQYPDGVWVRWTDSPTPVAFAAATTETCASPGPSASASLDPSASPSASASLAPSADPSASLAPSEAPSASPTAEPSASPVASAAPLTTTTSLTDGAQLPAGEQTFTAQSENCVNSCVFVWTLDGAAAGTTTDDNGGVAGTFTAQGSQTVTLEPGDHTVALTVTDSANSTTTNSYTVTVLAASAEPTAKPTQPGSSADLGGDSPSPLPLLPVVLMGLALISALALTLRSTARRQR